ncbi:MAG: thioredoxin domain-containing protein [Candidatus Pacebacteria bacterium]|nr:thioredoxin domain-containing protein [Candidatus Paceibacterota bacterium]
MDTNNINTPKKDFLLPASILIAGILVAGSVIYSTGLKTSGTGGTANIQQVVAGDAAKLEKDDPVIGDAKAPVTVIIYSDPSCPFCGAAAGQNKEVMDYLKQRMPTWTAAVPGIMEEYVKTGKVRLAFRYFPGHGKGVEAMKMMLCANDQGKFWEVHDKFFANQPLMENGQNDKLKELMAGMGLDMNKINSCLTSKKYDSKLDKDTASGKALNIQGTPALVINGQKMEEGAQPFAAVKEIIDGLLKK